MTTHTALEMCHAQMTKVYKFISVSEASFLDDSKNVNFLVRFKRGVTFQRFVMDMCADDDKLICVPKWTF
jgi:hypothetical protein